MTSSLDNLVTIGKLKKEPPAQSEIEGLIRSGMARLTDAGNASLSLDGRFDLAYTLRTHCHSPRCGGTGIVRRTGTWSSRR